MSGSPLRDKRRTVPYRSLARVRSGRPFSDPTNRAEQMRLESRVCPRALKVPERGVERAALPERLRPGERIIAGCTNRRRIEREQDLHAAPRVVAERVELVHETKRGAQIARRRMGAALDGDRRVL